MEAQTHPVSQSHVSTQGRTLKEFQNSPLNEVSAKTLQTLRGAGAPALPRYLPLPLE